MPKKSPAKAKIAEDNIKETPESEEAMEVVPTSAAVTTTQAAVAADMALATDVATTKHGLNRTVGSGTLPEDARGVVVCNGALSCGCCGGDGARGFLPRACRANQFRRVPGAYGAGPAARAAAFSRYIAAHECTNAPLWSLQSIPRSRRARRLRNAA